MGDNRLILLAAEVEGPDEVNRLLKYFSGERNDLLVFLNADDSMMSTLLDMLLDVSEKFSVEKESKQPLDSSTTINWPVGESKKE